MYPSRIYRTRRGIKILIGVSVTVLVLTAIGLIIMQVASPAGGGNSLLPPPVPNLFGSSPASPSPTATEPALTGPVQVIQGSQLINGVYLGYPHSSQGAVSAVDQFATQLGSTLDPDRAAAIMRLTADPSYAAGPQQFAQGVISERQELGLPVTGSVPPGASVVLDPVEYQVQDVTANQVTVLLLCDYVTTLPGQGTQTRIAVYPLRVHWADGDWKILTPASTSYTDLAAEPGSPQAASNGWQELSP
jgi:hypothetical protein